jgi:subtilisin family serine protease
LPGTVNPESCIIHRLPEVPAILPRLRPRRRPASLLAAGIMLLSSMAAPVSIAGSPSTVRLVVSFRPDTPAARADQMAAAGGRVVERIAQLNVRVVEVPAVAAESARGWWTVAGEVASVEADGLVAVDWIPPDPFWEDQWAPRQVRAQKAWNLERGSETTVVAVVDTGVQLKHPDLKDHLVSGHDFVNDDKRPRDDNGHGTAVAGVVAAIANSIGVAGICVRCRVMPVKTLAANGTGWWSVAAKGIIWAAKHRADVINLSFGGPTGGSVLQDAISYARSKGAVVIGAAGNYGSTNLFYPAAIAGVISVAGSDDLDRRFSFSNYSTGWVDLAAPGCMLTTARFSSYGTFCGTSFATPIVSGVAALVESARPSLTRAQIESILLNSTVHTPFAFTRLGRIDAYEAVYRALHGTAPSPMFLTPAAPLISPPAEVTFLAGLHAGYRFDASGSILRGSGISLAQNASGLTSKRMRIPNRDGHWYFMVDGALDGRWVPESDDVFLTPQPTPTPSPSATPSPSPTPTPAPTP